MSKQKTDNFDITARDYFAGLAMQARIRNLGTHFHSGRNKAEAERGIADCIAKTAKRAYQMADAMLDARNEK